MRTMPFDFAQPTTRPATLIAGFAIALLAAAVVATVNPVGYVGAGADDEQYLAAARCWIASGHPCVATARPSAVPLDDFLNINRSRTLWK